MTLFFNIYFLIYNNLKFINEYLLLFYNCFYYLVIEKLLRVLLSYHLLDIIQFFYYFDKIVNNLEL